MPEPHPALRAWLGTWRALQRYHRYRVHGLERLDGEESLLLVAYHGRPIALDQCLLSVSVYDRLGYMLHGVTHRAVRTNRLMTWVSDGLGFVTGDGPEVAQAIERGEHIAVQPGGIREGCRSFRHRYEVDWGTRVGFVRLALRYGLRVVPIASHGADDCFIGFNDGYRWGKRLGIPAGLPAWLGVGFGIWPLALPLPAPITTYIGEPIDLQDAGVIDPEDRGALLGAQRRIASAVQALLSSAVAL
ncbi:MAG: acyltransferase [Myxococcales bacterium]|nr:acyltransferase [Myxococcales bacterium]